MGDCWFLSAVAVLTEVSRISEVIITPDYNEEGIYTVRFCIQVVLFFKYLISFSCLIEKLNLWFAIVLACRLQLSFPYECRL